MGEGDDALGCAAHKVGRGALMVRVVSGPAVSAAPVIGTIAGFVSGILAVTPEAVDVGGECSLALPKGATWWGSWIFHHSPFEAIFSFAVLWVRVGGSLCCVDTRDDAAGRGSGASAKEMGDQACPNCRMRQMALHLILFFFSFEFLPS